MKAAHRLQEVKENWQSSSDNLSPALFYNRKLWTVLTQSALRGDNPLPDMIKQNIANLGVFIFKQTLETEVEPAPEKLTILITINREIAAGLQKSAA